MVNLTKFTNESIRRDAKRRETVRQTEKEREMQGRHKMSKNEEIKQLNMLK